MALDHMEWVLDLRSRLRFDLLDLAFGFVEHTAFAQAFVGATTSHNLPDYRSSFILRLLLTPMLRKRAINPTFKALG